MTIQQISTQPFRNPAIPSASDEYASLLPAETLAYLKIDSGYKYSCEEPSLEEKRKKYLLDCEVACPSGQFHVTRTNSTIFANETNIPLRQYCTENPRNDAQILFFHGGGFIAGNLESHDEICAKLCAKSHFRVTAVDYRLAPENTFPAAFEDSLHAYLELANSTSQPIILFGDSAGGNLAAAISTYCRDHDLSRPMAQVLIYPYLGADPSAGSYQRHRDSPAMNLEDLYTYKHCYFGSDPTVINDPRALPLRSFTFAELPPTYCQIAEIDPIADDGRLYCQFLHAAGVQAFCEEMKGLTHGYLRHWQHGSTVRCGWEKILSALDALAEGTFSHATPYHSLGSTR